MQQQQHNESAVLLQNSKITRIQESDLNTSFFDLKIGVVGCGKHLLEAHLRPTKELLAISQIVDPQAETILKQESTLLSESDPSTLEDLLISDTSVLLIGSPDEFHAQTLSAALRAGKHVFVEKPLAINSKEFLLLKNGLESAHKNGLVVSSCHPRRYDPSYLWIKSQIPLWSAQFGSVQNISLDFSYHKPSKAWKCSRSLLLDHLNHEVDLMHFFFDHCDFSAHRLFDSYDRYQVTGMRADGIGFNFMGTRKLNAHQYPETVQLRFERAEVTIDTTNGQVQVKDHESSTVVNSNCPKTDYALRGQKVLLNFLSAVKGTERSYLSHADLLVNTEASLSLCEKASWEYKVPQDLSSCKEA